MQSADDDETPIVEVNNERKSVQIKETIDTLEASKAVVKELTDTGFLGKLNGSLVNAERVAAAELKAFKAESEQALLLTFEAGGRARSGVASQAQLPIISDGAQWLRGTEANAGRVPGQIAEKLAGREFESFDAFRQAFWKEVAKDPVLGGQFKGSDVSRMQLGLAPEASPNQRVGGRTVYELDHSKPISEGGGVYDLNNLIVRTPLSHVMRHK